MINAFNKFNEENNLFKPEDKILLAVSGGIDSMVMTHLFLRTDCQTAIMHCNFTLRSRDSDKDEAFIRKFAESHSIPFFSIRFNTKEFAKNNSISVQMAARDLRYNWFEEIRQKYNYDLIAVAHNLNDNVETLLINLTRGTGLAGLSGMRLISNNIIRPLLFATRDDIVNYSNLHKIKFREDTSNADTKYIRNKIRHQIIPVLKEINPSIEITLNETAERFIGINEIVTGYISKIREKISEQKEDLISYNISQLKRYQHNSTIIFELFRPYGITNQQLDDLIKVINGKTGGQIITNCCRIIKNRKEIIVSQENSRTESVYKVSTEDGFKKIPGIVSAELFEVNDTFQIPYDSSIACLDYNKLSFPLIIRKWETGDSFYPLGMKQKKKLSDYFIDNKYSLFDKENRLILESDGEIVWIIGDRIDNRFKITRSTKKALIIKSATKSLIIKRLK
jgi:tRNA(Ile)-lysidine synthase